jgi:hypothetical protein
MARCPRVSTTATIVATGLVTGLTSFTAIFLQQELTRRSGGETWIRDRRLEACSRLDELTTKLHELCNLEGVTGEPADMVPKMLEDRLSQCKPLILDLDVALSRVVLVSPQPVRDKAGSLVREVKGLVRSTFVLAPSGQYSHSDLHDDWHRVSELRRITRESVRVSLSVKAGS